MFITFPCYYLQPLLGDAVALFSASSVSEKKQIEREHVIREKSITDIVKDKINGRRGEFTLKL